MRPAGSYRFYNGPIVTMDPDNPVAGEVITHGERIAWVGRRGDAPAEFRRARPVDLQGRLLLPAFADAHTHFVDYAATLKMIDLRGAKSLTTVLRRIAKRSTKSIEHRGWIVGRGLDVNAWGGRWPAREDLDRVIPDRPAVFTGHDGHSLWVNSEALRRCRITAQTPDPEGGRILRSANGELTGVLQETACELVWDKMPEPTLRQKQRFVQSAQTLAHAQGVAAICDVGESETLRVFQALRNRGQLQLRLWKSIPLDKLDAAIACGLESGIGDRWIKIGSVKIFMDGALGSRTAWMLKPYTSDRRSTGVCRLQKSEFEAILKKAARAGFSVCVHAIGDAAVRQVINGLVKYRARFPKHQPPRIEHLQVISPDDIRRLRRTGIIASMQPSHLLTDRDYADQHWGRRARLAFAFRSLWDVGVPMAFGSDVPIEPLAPLSGIGAAVNRARPDDSRGPWYRKQCLSAWEAVWGFTSGAALASGDLDERGLIQPQYLADLVVLDRNLFTEERKRIFETQVSMTFVGGHLVYDAGE